MSSPDDKILELQRALSNVDQTLEIQKKEHDNKGRIVKTATIVLVILVTLLLSLFIFRALSPTGFATVDDNQTNTSEQVLSELEETKVVVGQGITGSIENDVISNETVVNETLPEILPNETAVNETSQNETIPYEASPNETIVVNATNITFSAFEIILLSPANNSNTSTNITFSYMINDSADNCTLYTQYRYIQNEFLAAATQTALSLLD
jgi:hypothetical protein